MSKGEYLHIQGILRDPHCEICGKELEGQEVKLAILNPRKVRALCSEQCIEAFFADVESYRAAKKSTTKDLLAGMGYSPGDLEMERKLNAAGLASLSEEFDVDQKLLRALIAVESSGNGFDSKGRCKILMEGHYCWKLLRYAGQDPRPLSTEYPECCYPSWSADLSRTFYRMDQYQRYDRVLSFGSKLKKTLKVAPKTIFNPSKEAIEMESWDLYKQVAVASCSWGMFQVMGANFRAAGFGSLYDLKVAMDDSEYLQARAGLQFMKNSKSGQRNLLQVLQARDFEEFVSRYNGPGQVEAYCAKFKAALERLG